MQDNNAHPKALWRRRRPFYGWYVVAAAWMAFVTSYGVMIYAFLILYASWNREFGWGRGLVSGAYSAGLFTLAVTAPAVGKLTDLYGARRMMFLGNLVMGAGVLSLRWITEPWHLYAAFLGASLGFSAACVVPANALVARWFERRRGLAVGIAYTGIGIGGLAITPLANALIEAAGWQASVTALALLVWGIQLPLVLLVVRSDPYELGLLPDGRPGVAPGAPAARTRKRTEAYAHLPGWSLKEAARSIRFWIIAFFFFVALAASNGIFAQLQPLVLDQGYAASVAALLLSANGGVVTVVKFVYGYLSDRVPLKSILLFGCTGTIAAPALVLAVEVANAPRWLVLLMPIVLGTAAAAFSILVPIVAASAFGLRHIGAVAGALGSAMLLGMAAGPAFVGTLFDATGSYILPTSIAIGALALGLTLLMLGPSLRYQERPADAGVSEGAVALQKVDPQSNHTYQ